MRSQYYQVAISGCPGATYAFSGDSEWDYVAGGKNDRDEIINIEVIHKGPLIDYSVTPSGHHIVSREFRNAVEVLWGDSVTWFDINVGKHKMFLFRPEAIVDALDLDRSSISWIKGDNAGRKIRGVKRIALRKDVVCGDVFVLKGWEVALIVSRKSAQEIYKIKPLGIEFYEI